MCVSFDVWANTYGMGYLRKRVGSFFVLDHLPLFVVLAGVLPVKEDVKCRQLRNACRSGSYHDNSFFCFLFSVLFERTDLKQHAASLCCCCCCCCVLKQHKRTVQPTELFLSLPLVPLSFLAGR